MNILGFEVTRANGKFNWQDLRRLVYVALFVWAIGVRLFGIDPFDDFQPAKGVGLWTLFDALTLYAMAVITWHIVWPARPRI